VDLRGVLLGGRAGGGRAVDAWLAAGVAAFGVVGTLGAGGNQPDARPPDALAWALLLLAAASLPLRRRHPVAVLAVTAAATLTWLLAGYPWGPAFLPLSVAVYTLAAAAPRGRFPLLAAAVAALLAAAVAVGASDADGEPLREELPRVLLAWMALLLLPLWVGWAVRARRERDAEQRRRRDDQQRLAVARELHDVVSHSIAMINFRAGVALHVLDRRPGQAREALEAIRDASDGAMQELRATLGVLRHAGDGDAPRAPAPGLARLDALAAGMARAGRRVEVLVDGEPAALPPAVDLAAYRVVQESLTNVVRHAGPAAATVRVAYRPTELVVEVSDDGARPAGGANGGGHGIAGMRERVEALGGELDAGPVPAGGFRVRARLPIGRAEPVA
jgi:signal transduction histidine kinase